MAAGLPVVTTSIGSEGMGLVDGVHALVADTPEEFAAAVVRLSSDDSLWNQLADAARQLLAHNIRRSHSCRQTVADVGGGYRGPLAGSVERTVAEGRVGRLRGALPAGKSGAAGSDVRR